MGLADKIRQSQRQVKNIIHGKGHSRNESRFLFGTDRWVSAAKGHAVYKWP